MTKKLWVLTLFPEFFVPFQQCGVIARALESHSLNLVNIRDFALNNYKSVDDTPFGGAPGMIMRADILKRAFIEGVVIPGNYSQENEEWKKEILFLYTSPRGKSLSQIFIKEIRSDYLGNESQDGRDLVILCGRYEGVDERFLQLYVEQEISLGDFVLSGGEIAAMAILDALLRLLPGVLGNQESLKEESFEDYLLEGPQYTKPREFEGQSVPGIYLSGHHKKMAEFRFQERLRVTRERRPDLYSRYLEQTAQKETKKKRREEE